jgi:hypothetical protein
VDGNRLVADPSSRGGWPGLVRRHLAGISRGWREVLLMAAAYGLYSLIKGVRSGDLETGRENATLIMQAEQTLGLDVERGLQETFIDAGLAMPFWSFFYVASQVVVLPLVLFLVYRLRRAAYPFVRNLALLSWCIGVAWYALQPVAPPRMMGAGLVDTVSRGTFIDLDSEFVRAFYNPVAAMPSLHVGMAPVVAWALVALTPWAATRVLGVLYPAVVTVTVVVTGNHYLLDVAGGLVVVAVAAVLARLVTEPSAGLRRAAARLRAGRPAPEEREPAGTGSA